MWGDSGRQGRQWKTKGETRSAASAGVATPKESMLKLTHILIFRYDCCLVTTVRKEIRAVSDENSALQRLSQLSQLKPKSSFYHSSTNGISFLGSPISPKARGSVKKARGSVKRR
jgi:hypothetical protein